MLYFTHRIMFYSLVWTACFERSANTHLSLELEGTERSGCLLFVPKLKFGWSVIEYFYSIFIFLFYSFLSFTSLLGQVKSFEIFWSCKAHFGSSGYFCQVCAMLKSPDSFRVRLTRFFTMVLNMALESMF